MENWELIAVILISIFIGAMIPALFMLAATLSAIRRRIVNNGTRVDDIMKRVDVVSARIEMVSRGLEGSDEEVAKLIHATGALADRLMKAQESVRVATAVANAVGPAIAAFVHGLGKNGDAAATETAAAEHNHQGGDHG